MRYKKGNISVILLIALLVVMGGSVITSMAVKSKYDGKESYTRLENRYIAESGIDLAGGLFLNYLANQDFVLSYTQNEDGSYSLVDEYAPYILDEIRQNENSDSIPLSALANECNSYLSGIGYMDFVRNKGVEVSISIFNQKDNFKLSRLCTGPRFVVSQTSEAESVSSRINPLYLTVKSCYKGGEVLCNMEIKDISVVRNPFYTVKTGELANVSAKLDVSRCKVIYNNYQNYRR